MTIAILVIFVALLIPGIYCFYKLFFGYKRQEATLANEWKRLHEADIREAADSDPDTYFRRGLERLQR